MELCVCSSDSVARCGQVLVVCVGCMVGCRVGCVCSGGVDFGWSVKCVVCKENRVGGSVDCVVG